MNGAMKPVNGIELMTMKTGNFTKMAAHSKQDITCHAEIEAIRKARRIVGQDMSECTLISTHEPCVMCRYAIRLHKIARVVYRKKVKPFGSITSSMEVLST